jgi:hypothetical protein
MKAVWSFWSTPFFTSMGFSWPTLRHNLYSWVLSFETARAHFPQTQLVTDDRGARLLVDDLGLRFDEVSFELNEIDGELARWWALGKLYTYRIQREPFLHIDGDAFLWKPLPEELLRAPVIGQSPERISMGYRPEKFDVLRIEKGWIAPEIDWYRPTGMLAVDCGIAGGCNTGFMRVYADNAIRMIEDQRNRPVWKKIGEDNILVEQYYLSACIDYYSKKVPDRLGRVEIKYLFENPDAPFEEREAKRVGFTHLLGNAKKHPDNLDAIERRVRQEYPEHYERCRSAAQ